MSAEAGGPSRCWLCNAVNEPGSMMGRAAWGELVLCGAALVTPIIATCIKVT